MDISKFKSKRSENLKKDKKQNLNYGEEYSYDFIPSFYEWLNIDEQKENVKRLEDIEKEK